MTTPEPCLCGAEDCEECFPIYRPSMADVKRGYDWYPDDYDPGPDDSPEY